MIQVVEEAQVRVVEEADGRIPEGGSCVFGKTGKGFLNYGYLAQIGKKLLPAGNRLWKQLFLF